MKGKALPFTSGTTILSEEYLSTPDAILAVVSAQEDALASHVHPG